MSEKIIKTRTFSIVNNDLNEIKKTILKLEGIETVIDKSQSLIISYDLRQNNYQTIKQQLHSITDINKESIFTKLRSSFISFCERNETDHANKQTGWDSYIQNMYLSLHRKDYQ